MKNRRVSLYLNSKIIDQIDDVVDGIAIRSRSEAIERILTNYLSDRKTVVILAGGQPQDVKISGLGVYRPLAKIGKKTLVEDMLFKCREAGFKNIIIVGNPSVIAKIYEVLGDGMNYDLSINYVEDKEALGTAKTLEKVKKYIKTEFLLVPCDHYFDFDLRKLYEFHIKNDGTASFGVHTRTTFEYLKTSVVEMDGFKIVNYEEHPKKPKTHLVCTFIGFLKPEVFDYIPPGNVFWSMQEHVFPKLAKEGKMFGYPVAGNWVNVHTKKDVDLAIALTNK